MKKFYTFLFVGSLVFLNVMYQETYISDDNLPNYPVAPFRVNGRHILDAYKRTISMKGFNLDRNQALGYSTSYTQEDFHRMKEWGFHFVYMQDWWWELETQSGEYQQDRLLEWQEAIDMCKNASLYCIFRFRVSYSDDDPPSWQGWTRHAYVHTEEGLARYCDMLKWAITFLDDRFPNTIIAYHLWQFPWHDTHSFNQSQRVFYYSRVVPELVESARKVVDKPLLVSSIHCKPEDFANFQKVDDDNVLYGFAYYRPQVVGIGEEPPWSGDVDEQWEMVENAVAFMNTYDIPLIVVEFGIRSDRDDQRSKLKLKLQILDYCNVAGWCAWEYGYGCDESFDICLCPDGSDCKWGIVELYRQYNYWRGPSLSLSPRSGFSCTTLVGSGFAPNSKVSISWDGNALPTVPSPLTTDSYGNFTATISVPTQSEPGSHIVNATDELTDWASETFTVTNMVGPEGPQGEQGAKGDKGDPASVEYIVALALPGIIAICVVVYALIRKGTHGENVST